MFYAFKREKREDIVLLYCGRCCSFFFHFFTYCFHNHHHMYCFYSFLLFNLQLKWLRWQKVFLFWIQFPIIEQRVFIKKTDHNTISKALQFCCWVTVSIVRKFLSWGYDFEPQKYERSQKLFHSISSWHGNLFLVFFRLFFKSGEDLC